MENGENNHNEEKKGYQPMTDAQLRKARRISTIISVVVAVIVIVLIYLKNNGVI